MVFVVVSVAKSDVSSLSGLCCQVRCKFSVVVSVPKSDESGSCCGLCFHVRCKLSVLWSLFPCQM